LHRSLSSPHVSLCGRVRRSHGCGCKNTLIGETDSWVRVRLTVSGTRDGRYAAARLGPAVDRCWRRRHNFALEGASTSWLSAETRPVTFTRCGYAICIPRRPAIHDESIFRQLCSCQHEQRECRLLVLEPANLDRLPLRVLTIPLDTTPPIHLRLRHLISLLDKEKRKHHECRGYRQGQPDSAPSLFSSHPRLPLS
jgi:hypothetical protein